MGEIKGRNLTLYLLCLLSVLRGCHSLDVQDPTEWSDLPVSPSVFGYAPYGPHSIPIYESVGSSPKQYFFAPVLLLQPQSSRYRNVGSKQENSVTFEMLMWNEDVSQAVVDFLGETAKRPQIKPIPFDRVHLQCDTLAESCNCPNEWLPYNLRKVMHFKIVCSSKLHAEQLVDTFKSNAETLRSLFTVSFATSSKKPRQVTVDVTAENIRGTNLFSLIEQRFPTKNEILLTTEDAEKLVSESIASVSEPARRENEMVSGVSEKKIRKTIEDLLSMRTTRIGASVEAWDAVFWSADVYRPDELARELNEFPNSVDRERIIEALTKGDVSVIDEILDSLSLADSARLHHPTYTQDSETRDAWYDSLDSASNGVDDVSARIPVKKSLKETLSRVEWNGNKFAPKVANLQRINLAKLRMVEMRKEVTVLFITPLLTLPVNIDHEESSSTSFDFRSELQRLRNELKNISMAVGQAPSVVARDKVIFYATGSSNVIGSNQTVTFNELPVNVGNAFIAGKGIFTAPRDGHFAFFFHATATRTSGVSLSLNHERVIASSVVDIDAKEDAVLSLSAVVALKKGDQVSVFLHIGVFKGYLNFVETVAGTVVKARADSAISFSGFSLD